MERSPAEGCFQDEILLRPSPDVNLVMRGVNFLFVAS
jgi:hypothetical protein